MTILMVNLESIEMNIKVSVIIPMYNVESYLKECIMSVLNQEYKNFEILLIDDGSTDNTSTIAKKFADSYDNIRYFHSENKGQASARNIGLMIASGDYISFIDSDDYIHPKMFSEMLNLSTKYDLDIIECCYGDVFPSTKKVGKRYYLEIEKNRIYDGYDFYNLEPSLSTCDKIFKKSFLDNLNFRCSEGYYAEDAYDTTYLMLNAKKIMHINEVYYFYRRDNLESTRNNKKENRILKLAGDKLYIAKKLDLLNERNKYPGYINTVISRLIIGSIFNPYALKNSSYRNHVLKKAKEYSSFTILYKNFKIRMVFKFIGLVFRKLMFKGD